MTYRTEIDGLRAISVLAVILYHAGFKGVAGGFAGVDVFFVISGYLIGGQILKELAEGRFSYRSFYSRRARRILPALFAVILASVVAGYFILLANDYRYFFGAAFTSLLSLSNFWFMDQIDYFNPQAALDPLVHTWSLGVEEQFYLFAPILLGAAWLWFRRLIVAFLVVLTVASLALMFALSTTAPMFSFYMLPTRAWELFAGILVAIAIGKPWWSAWRRWHGPLALVGLIFLLAGLVFTPSGVAWPGEWTIVPVFGTLLALAFGQADSFTKMILSIAPMRILGLISYSAYLWHQPVLSFLEYSGNMPTSVMGRMVVILVVLGFAGLSWRVIEQPFRNGAAAGWWGKMGLVGAAVAIVAVSVGGYITKGYPSRIPQEISAFMSDAQTTGPFNKPCLLTRGEVDAANLDDSCIIGAEGDPTVVLWGDSHAAAIADALSDVMVENGRTLQTFMLSSCLPIPNLVNHSQKRQAQCPAYNARVQDHIIADDAIDYVVLFATWDSYFLRRGYPGMLGYSEDDDFYAYPTGGDANMPNDARLDSIQSELERLVGSLIEAGKTVVLVQSAPRPNVDIPRYFARQAWAGTAVPENSGYPVEYANAQSADSRRIMNALDVGGAPESLVIVDPSDAFCDDALCYVIKDGAVLFSDGDHPSLEGGKRIAPLIAAAIAPL